MNLAGIFLHFCTCISCNLYHLCNKKIKPTCVGFTKRAKGPLKSAILHTIYRKKPSFLQRTKRTNLFPGSPHLRTCYKTINTFTHETANSHSRICTPYIAKTIHHWQCMVDNLFSFITLLSDNI